MSVLKSNIVRINGDFLELRYSLLSLLLWEYSLHLPHWFQTEALKTDTLMAVFLVVNCTTLWPEFIFVLLCLANSLSCQTETQMYSVWKMSKSLYYRCAITLFVLYNNIIPERKLQHRSQRLFSLWSLRLIFIRLHWNCDIASFFKAERWTDG